MPNFLAIAFHFPPSAESSGHLRTLAFTRYLPALGWQPVVLSAHPRAYSRTDNRLLEALPQELPVIRAFALDAQKHLSIRGSYPLLLEQPDRWSSWWLGAVIAGFRLIKRYRPTVIWSTSPIATAHLIAHTLHRRTGLPWIADFRDPINVSSNGNGTLTHRVRARVEKKTIRRSTYNVFTTQGAAQLYTERYPWRRTEDFVVIPNGYDESDFADFPAGQLSRQREAVPLRLVHSGLLYREQRDPKAFFDALGELASTREISMNALQVILRASGHEDYYRQLIHSAGLEDLVHLRPAIPYREALEEQYEADGLLLFQGSAYNRQIPAKIYEYLRIGRPIFALTDPSGDTAATLRSAGIGMVTDMTSKEAIIPALRQFLQGIRRGTLPVLSPGQVAQYSRRARTEELAALLDEAARGRK
jgi:glycosyltransferase involved in cell wall biosynthesis